jgi:hypothetical protein
MIPHTNFYEIEEKLLKETTTKFLDIYPGESTDLEHPVNTSTTQRDLLANESNSPIAEIPRGLSLSDEQFGELADRLQKFKDLKGAFNIENVLFSIKVGDREPLSIDLRDEGSSTVNHVECEIPEYIAWIMFNQTINFDHIAIGYWGKWKRSTPDYPANFMRALQVGVDFLSKFPRLNPSMPIASNILDSSVATIIEMNPDLIYRVFNRHGLPCVGCFYSPTESLRTAIDRHRLPIGSEEKIVNEIKMLVFQEDC